MERLSIWKNIEKKIRHWREEKHLDKEKLLFAEMVIHVVPKSYLKGSLRPNHAVESYMEETDPITGIQNRFLLARAAQDIESEDGVIGFFYQNQGKSGPFVRFEKGTHDNRSTLTIVFNANHPSFSFKRSETGGMLLDIKSGFELFQALIQAQIIKETQPEETFVSRESIPPAG